MKRSVFLPLGAFIFFLILLQVLDRDGHLNRSLLPAPKELWIVALDNWSDQIWPAFQETFLHAFLGLILSFFAGTTLAIILSLSQVLRETISPFAVLLQTIPIVAIAPLLVIYLGFGAGTIIASAIFVSVFPILVGTLAGLHQMAPQQKNLFILMRAGRWQTLHYLQIPSAYSSMMIGLKNAAGLSVIGVVSGEFVAGSGLGSVIDAARTQQKIELVFISLILLAGIGIFFSLMIRLLHWGIHQYRPYAHNLDLS